MEYTLLFVSWLRSFEEETAIQMTVGQSLSTIYTTLKQEQVDVQIVKIDENCDQEIVRQEEINKEQQDVYRLEINLADSNIPVKRFNDLLKTWKVIEVEVES